MIPFSLNFIITIITNTTSSSGLCCHDFRFRNGLNLRTSPELLSRSVRYNMFPRVDPPEPPHLLRLHQKAKIDLKPLVQSDRTIGLFDESSPSNIHQLCLPQLHRF